MNISTEKPDVIQRICEIQDNDLIDMIKNIIDIPRTLKSDWWNQISLEAQESINSGLNDLKQGKVYSHGQIRTKYENGLKIKWTETSL